MLVVGSLWAVLLPYSVSVAAAVAGDAAAVADGDDAAVAAVAIDAVARK